MVVVTQPAGDNALSVALDLVGPRPSIFGRSGERMHVRASSRGEG